MIAPLAPCEWPEGFHAALVNILGAAGVRERAAIEVLDPGMHGANLGATLMARPASTEEAARVLALCARTGVGVVPQGGRTGLSGGAESRPGELILALDRMDRIEHLEPLARTATVQAGVTLARLEAALAPHGLSAGIDLGARDSATIGGMVATNAGGIEAFRHGPMRSRVLGLEAALASGEVLRELSRIRKDNAGLALRQLFIGSEGTLGVITRVVLDLVPQGGARRTALALFGDLEAAIGVMRSLERDATRLAADLVAAELMSGNHLALSARALGIGPLAALAPAAYAVLFAVSAHEDAVAAALLERGLERAIEAGQVIDAVLPKNASEERDLWRVREDWAVDRAHPGGLWYDVSVPIDRLAAYLAGVASRLARHDAALAMFIVGHLADGNVHFTINAARPIPERYAEVAPLIYEGLKELGGSFSAEHGIGLEKRASLERWSGAPRLALMRAVKTVFDPAGIMNPGKMLSRD
jgi:FAD/FMN-containing dehydrogenase